jgi:hypothetical protein
MSSKPQTVSKGILDAPATIDQDFMQKILPVVQSSHPQSLELYRAPNSPNIAIDLTENNELTYQFPRKRKFPDSTENWSARASELRFKVTKASQEPSLRVASRENSSLFRKNDSAEVAEDRKTETQETQVTLEEIQRNERGVSDKSEWKNEINKEIDSMRKALEQQIETVKILGNQETHQKINKLKQKFEEIIQSLLFDVKNLKNNQNKERIGSPELKNVERIPEIDNDLKYLYKLIMDLKEKLENHLKHPAEQPTGIVAIVEAYFKTLKDSIDLRLKELNTKTEEMKGLRDIICEEKQNLRELKMKISTYIKKNNFKHYKHKFLRTFTFIEFSDIFDEYMARIPEWHRENLIKSLDVAELYEDSHPFWLEYLRKNFANGKNWYIDCNDWLWVPFEGSAKEKIKHYVLFWEFIECETLNNVRKEIGFDQVLVLGGGSFPYRITYLKYKLPAIPLWWNELIDELNEEGLMVVEKSKDYFEESNRIIQICRKKN